MRDTFLLFKIFYLLTNILLYSIVKVQNLFCARTFALAHKKFLLKKQKTAIQAGWK